METNVAAARPTRIAKAVIDIIWWLVLVGTVLVVVWLLLPPVLLHNLGLHPTVEAEVALEHGSVLRTVPLASPDAVVASHPVLHEAQARLAFQTSRWGLKLVSTLVLLPGLVGALLVLQLLRRLLHDVREGAVFTADNARRITWLGWLLVAMGLLEPVLGNARTALILMRAKLTGVSLAPAPAGGGWDLLLPGLLVLVLAVVWHYGVELQQERDLTV